MRFINTIWIYRGKHEANAPQMDCISVGGSRLHLQHIQRGQVGLWCITGQMLSPKDFIHPLLLACLSVNLQIITNKQLCWRYSHGAGGTCSHLQGRRYGAGMVCGSLPWICIHDINQFENMKTGMAIHHLSFRINLRLYKQYILPHSPFIYPITNSHC
jgi:hypothetical protein